MEAAGILCWLLLLGLTWLFRMAYLGWMGQFLLWAVLLLPPLVSLLDLPALLGLRLELRAPEHAHCGDKAELQLLFHTARRFPVGKVRLQLVTENLYTGEKHRSQFSFDAVGESMGALPIPTEDCGALRLSVRRWTCSDPLGLLALRKRAPSPALCVVLPRPVQPDQALADENPPETQPRMKPKYGGGFAEDHELRPYRPGDAVNSVHWKLSSKTDDWIVREPLLPENDRIYLVLEADGEDHRGLESLYWLSLRLAGREIPHRILSRELWPVTDEAGTVCALHAILSSPPTEPAPCDFSDARVIYRIRGGEVRVC